MLTLEEIQAAIKNTIAEELTKLKEPIGKFKPGASEGKVEVIVDEADHPFRSLGEQLQAVAKVYTPGGGIEPRLRNKIVDGNGVIIKATGLGESVPADGGFLIQQEFIPKLLEKTYEFGILAAKCNRIPVGQNFNGIKMPAVNETSLASSRFGGIIAYWGAEAGTKSASVPQFRQISLELKKLYGLCYATDELLQDATALEGWIMRAFPMEIGFQIDDAIINGNGAGRPLGVLSSPCLVSVAKETGQQAATIVFENVKKMRARFWMPSWPKAAWYINQDTLPELEGMSLAVGTGGIPVFMPAGGISGKPYDTLYGRPLIPIWQCATLGTVGDIILADFDQYLLIEKGGIAAASSIHVRFVYDETAFRFVYRCDGQPWWNSALTPYKGSNTQSPFITLATRS